MQSLKCSNIIALLIAFTLTMMCARATEWPTLRYWPGSFAPPDAVRLSSDGKYITLTSPYHVVVIDVESKFCVFTMEFALIDGVNFQPNWPRRIASVSESGDEFVVVDTAGRVAWYHVGNTLPWKSHTIGINLFEHVRMIDDTTVIVGSQYEVVVCRATAAQPQIVKTQIPAEQWLRDSLAYVKYAVRDSIGFFNPFDSTFLWATKGEVFGVDEQGRVIVYVDESVYAHDAKSGLRTLIIDSLRFPRRQLIRRRFLPIHREVVDLRDNSRMPNVWEVRDVLANGMMITSDNNIPTIFIDRLGGEADTIPVLIGQLYSHTQDPLDSTIYAFVGGGYANGFGQIGNYASIKPNAIWTPDAGGYVTTLSPFRMIRDTAVVLFTVSPEGTNGPRSEGYMTFEDFHSKGPTAKVAIEPQTYSNLREHFFRFSQDGDTLSLASDRVDAKGCMHTTTNQYPINSTATGFVPGTRYYVFASKRFHLYDCSDVIALPFNVISLSLHQDRVVGRADGSVVMASVSAPTHHYATVASSQPRHHTWSQAGTTFRFTTDMRSVISMYSTGQVRELQLPASFPSDSASAWWWSHDGSVVTIHSMDTIVSIDVETGDVLRDYVNIPWRAGNQKFYQVVYRVSELDARILVSMPSGSLAMVPGLAINGRTSVHEERSYAAHELSQALTINNALGNSEVRIYSVHGIEVQRAVTDANGHITLADKGLPHGAYVVVYETMRRVISRMLLR